MSTRSMIGLEYPDGKIKAIYCHNDGYLAGVGLTLACDYTDLAKVKKLISLGDLSQLGPDPDVRGTHQSHVVMFGATPAPLQGPEDKRACSAYHRDWGDDLHIAEYHNIRAFSRDAMRDADAEYVYLFRQNHNGNWHWSVKSTHNFEYDPYLHQKNNFDAGLSMHWSSLGHAIRQLHEWNAEIAHQRREQILRRN